MVRERLTDDLHVMLFYFVLFTNELCLITTLWVYNGLLLLPPQQPRMKWLMNQELTLEVITHSITSADIIIIIIQHWRLVKVNQ